jgi:hypothetical protein
MMVENLPYRLAHKNERAERPKGRPRPATGGRECGKVICSKQKQREREREKTFGINRHL